MALFAVLFPHVFTKIGISQADMADKIVGAIGSVFAIYGRLAATQVATLTGK